MVSQRCPCCGDLFNGKRCHNCGYVPFREDAPQRRVILLVLATLILVAVAAGGFVLMQNVSLPLREPLVTEAEPEPEGMTLLYWDDRLRISAQTASAAQEGSFPIVVENFTDQTVAVNLKEIVANGYVMEISTFSLTVGPKDVASQAFVLDETDLRYAGIVTVEEVSFLITAYDTKTYTSLVKTERTSLELLPKGSVVYEAPQMISGAVIFEEEGVRILYQGYAPSPEAPTDFSKGSLRFCVENNTDRHLRVSTPGVRVNGEDAQIGIWTELPPQTRAMTGMYLNGLRDLEIRTAGDVKTLEYDLEFLDTDSGWASVFEGETFPLKIS